MNPEVSDWIALTALVTSFVAYLEAKKANKTGEAINALQVVIEASEKTQTYLLHRAEGGEREREKEWDLAERWSHASFLISRVNNDLSVRLSAKSKFWRNPDTWETDLRASKDISLESVTNDAKRIMESYA
ncbi:hypothetical protein [Vibrio fluvialis]|uniref:hypothetical protein n=1 Tax=Vibrio fluvialis TaxID=676 RepID=UPI001C9BD0C6|nr:hypothetical protein [Vibrio fluvialis]MBY8286613.1 hypothetical protein [Vibrio fluvialis]MCE7647362.1 hypothetical protein [Vibrio fluvialis]